MGDGGVKNEPTRGGLSKTRCTFGVVILSLSILAVAAWVYRLDQGNSGGRAAQEWNEMTEQSASKMRKSLREQGLPNLPYDPRTYKEWDKFCTGRETPQCIDVRAGKYPGQNNPKIRKILEGSCC
jgi:hypothetical protein